MSARHHHYHIIDMGTFGGPQSFQNLGSLAVGVWDKHGAFGGWADTSVIDPLCSFDFPDCYSAHALVWRNSAKTDLGVLPGGRNSQVNWISANGLTAGVADNGQMDPLIGIPQIRGAFWGHDGVITDVGSLPGAYFANPLAVNSRGEVVGYATNTIPERENEPATNADSHAPPNATLDVVPDRLVHGGQSYRLRAHGARAPGVRMRRKSLERALDERSLYRMQLSRLARRTRATNPAQPRRTRRDHT